jgi:hypothetical protein
MRGLTEKKRSGTMNRFSAWIARVILLSILCLGALAAQARTLRTTEVPFRPDLRALGMGGAYIAAGKNGGAFLYNPALLVQSRTDVSVPVSIGVDQTVIDMFKFLKDNADSLGKFSDLTPEDQDKLYRDMTSFDGDPVRVRISPMFNIVTRHFGLVAYGMVRAGASVDKGIFEPRIAAEGRADAVVAMGIANRISDKMSIGVTGKVINSRFTSFRLRITDTDSTFDAIIDSLKTARTGFAADIGMLYQLSERTTLGVAIQDIYGKVGSEKYPVNFKAGIAWTTNRITLAADVTDLLNRDGVSLFNRVFMGGEVRIPLINIRAGFYQGYPTLGAGLNIKILKIDYAMYRVETAGRPGIAGRGQHEAQIKLGWGW